MRTRTAVALGSVAGSLGCFTGWAVMWLRYSPWGDPGALTIGVRLAAGGILLLVLPVFLVISWVLREVRREIRRSGLSPFQVAVIETAGLEALHHEMHKRNQVTSARLTASVMGPERRGQWPDNMN